MKIEDIMELWQEDAKIDKTEIGDESLKIPLLHSKYYNILIKEKLLLRRFEFELKKLKLDKYEFFTQGHNEETIKLNWKLPPKGMILKADIPMYLDSDSDIVELSLKIGIQQEKIEFLESVIKTIINRGFILKTALDFQKFAMGA